MTGRAGRPRSPDPDVERLLAGLAGMPPLETMTPADARAAMSAANPMLCPDMPACDERHIVLGGVPVRSYRPRDSGDRLLPALLFFHGGGWVMGNVDGYAPLCATLACRADVCVLSVDYRLAPEHPFPAALEDAVAASTGLDADVAALGIDEERIAVGGDSAGGNLAAALCLVRRDEAAPRYRLQLLLYPVLDARLDHPSYSDFGEGWFLTGALMRWFRDLYLGPGGKTDDWRASPLLAERLGGLPSLHIVTCGLDPLQDEGRLWADRMEDAGIDVRRYFYARQIHGFLFMERALPAAVSAWSDIASGLSRALRA